VDIQDNRLVFKRNSPFTLKRDSTNKELLGFGGGDIDASEIIPDAVYTGQAAPSGPVLNESVTLVFNKWDGTGSPTPSAPERMGTAIITAATTADNLSLQDLVDDVNRALKNSAGLSDFRVVVANGLLEFINNQYPFQIDGTSANAGLLVSAPSRAGRPWTRFPTLGRSE